MTALALPPQTTPTSPPLDGWRAASLSVFWGSLGLVTVLWFGGLQLVGPAETITAIGRLAGLLGSDLLLLQVLLMARIPQVERAFGQDVLARIHRTVGFTSFTLVLGHIVLILVGYAATARKNLLAETVDVVWTYPGMLLATAGFVALVMVVVTSIKTARTKLRYESWHLLHLYAYLGVGLALPHQLWTGADFIANPLASAFWWTAWGLTAAAVIGYRVIAPVRANLRWRLHVDHVTVEAPGVVSVSITGPSLPPVKAGQFFVFRFRDGAGWTRGNPYSLSAAPDGRTLRMTALDRGRLASLRPGTRVYVEGPYGKLTRTTDRPVAVLANGIGVTPGIALLQSAPYDGVLVHRGEPILDAPSDVRVVQVPGPRAARGSWLPEQAAHLPDHEALLRLVPDVCDREVFVSGTAEWVEYAERAALAAGVPRERVHAERFSW